MPLCPYSGVGRLECLDLHDLGDLLIVKQMHDGERGNDLTWLLYGEDKKPIHVE